MESDQILGYKNKLFCIYLNVLSHYISGVYK